MSGEGPQRSGQGQQTFVGPSARTRTFTWTLARRRDMIASLPSSLLSVDLQRHRRPKAPTGAKSDAVKGAPKRNLRSTSGTSGRPRNPVGASTGGSVGKLSLAAKEHSFLNPHRTQHKALPRSGVGVGPTQEASCPWNGTHQCRGALRPPVSTPVPASPIVQSGLTSRPHVFQPSTPPHSARLRCLACRAWLYRRHRRQIHRRAETASSFSWFPRSPRPQHLASP